MREAIALKAAVEPILMSERSVVNSVAVRIEFTGTFDRGWMYRKKLENGRALSRAKANVWRDVVARILIALQTSSARMIAERPLAAALDCVALWKACIKENPVGGSRTDSTSPIVNRKVMRMMNPRVPLMRAVEIMHHGTIFEASLISSAKMKLIISGTEKKCYRANWTYTYVSLHRGLERKGQSQFSQGGIEFYLTKE